MSGAANGIARSSGKIVLPDIFGWPALSRTASFQPFRQGIEIFPLYGEPTNPTFSGPSAALLRYAPGAQAPAHEHAGYEHILVLEGSQRDAQGTYSQGDLVISEPGSRHTVTSDQGCVVLAVWNRPVMFMQAEEP